MGQRKAIHLSIEETKEQQEYISKVQERVKGKELKYHLVTYGCQMNVHDSEKLAGMLSAMGYSEVSEQSHADLVLFNTCCVRENAEQRVYGNVGALKPYKQNNPNLIIGVCGCMMQQPEVSAAIAETFPFVDLIFGTHNLHHLPNLLLQAMDSRHTVLEVLDEEGRVVEDLPIKRTPGVSAWVTVMYGCNNYCSYCIVPYVRGRERSRLSPDILNEIRGLAKDGYKEITLLGQNVNSYGKDFNSDYRFSDLLRDINKIGGVERIRFMTSHPKDLSLDLIDTMAECEKVCEHIHLPIQSGSNRILKEMNRRYTREDYIDLVHAIRERIPGISITTDIIVGFPGETDEDFQDTLEIMDRIKYDSAYTFLYSKRTGTPAAKMEGQIDIGLKKKRLHALMELQNNLSGENNKSSLNSVVEVLVEGLSKSADNIYSGRTRNNKLVHFSAGRNVIGELVKVKINNPRTWTLEGIMI